MQTIEPRIGRGRFQWNAGGWFGSLFGCTAFLLTGAAAFFSHSPSVAAVWIVCYVAAIALGVLVWTRRGSLDPYIAVQWQLLVLGIASTIAISFGVLHCPELFSRHDSSPTQAFCVLLIFPAMMAFFHWMERSARDPNA